MHRTLERLDAAASTIVPLLYLVGLSLGTLAYFTGVTADFNLAVGSALAFAAEVHSFLQLRRTRATYGALSRMPESDPRRDGMVRQLRVNLAILAALVSFSAYNATAFAAETWRPTAGWLPIPAQIAIRGLIIPVFFLLAGFLSPLTQDAGALLADASHSMLHKTLRTTLRQWRRRVSRAEKRGLDLAPVAIALMRDAGDEDGARRVALIADGLNAAEGLTPPTGPGTPLPAPTYEALPADDDDQSWRKWTPGVIYPERSARSNPGAVASERVPSGELSAEAIRRKSAFGILDSTPGMSVSALAKALKCRWETARDLHAAWTDHRLAQKRGISPRPLPATAGTLALQPFEQDEPEAPQQAAV